MQLRYLTAALLTFSSVLALATGNLDELDVPLAQAEENLAAREPKPALPKSACQNKCTLHQDCTKSGCVVQGQHCNLTVYEGERPGTSYNLPSTNYTLYYAGSGYALNQDSPPNDFSGNHTYTTFNGALKPCAAAQACSDFCRGRNPDIYNSKWSWTLYWRFSSKKWHCEGYVFSNNPESDDSNSGNTPASYWNVRDKDIEVGYGYTFPYPYDD